jgi:phospholipase C
MDGFVTDYISTFTGEMGRQPTYEEYAHIMTGCTPEQLPVLNGIARDFGVFDHWFCEVPSQTFMNRSFWTAATSSGLVVNSPMRKWFTKNDAETLFERLEARGETWKVYVMEPMPLSFTGVIHFPRLKDRLATHFVPFAEFETDAAAGTLPDFSLIEPNMLSGHGDYHPAFGRSFSDTVDLAMDSPSAMLSGEAFLERVYSAYRSATSPTGANVWNTPLLIGWDEPGGTYDHVAPGPVPPDPAAAAGELGFTFDRSGYRVPAIIVSPWVEPGSVYNEEYRHTSLIATLRKRWGLGEPFTQRDASARTFDHLFSRATPRDPQTWAAPQAHPVPGWTMDPEVVGQGLSALGMGIGPALIARAQQMGVQRSCRAVPGVRATLGPPSRAGKVSAVRSASSHRQGPSPTARPRWSQHPGRRGPSGAPGPPRSGCLWSARGPRRHAAGTGELPPAAQRLGRGSEHVRACPSCRPWEPGSRKRRSGARGRWLPRGGSPGSATGGRSSRCGWSVSRRSW